MKEHFSFMAQVNQVQVDANPINPLEIASFMTKTVCKHISHGWM
jgi:hypothetical protein